MQEKNRQRITELLQQHGIADDLGDIWPSVIDETRELMRKAFVEIKQGQGSVAFVCGSLGEVFEEEGAMLNVRIKQKSRVCIGNIPMVDPEYDSKKCNEDTGVSSVFIIGAKRTNPRLMPQERGRKESPRVTLGLMVVGVLPEPKRPKDWKSIIGDDRSGVRVARSSARGQQK